MTARKLTTAVAALVAALAFAPAPVAASDAAQWHLSCVEHLCLSTAIEVVGQASHPVGLSFGWTVPDLQPFMTLTVPGMAAAQSDISMPLAVDGHFVRTLRTTIRQEVIVWVLSPDALVALAKGARVQIHGDETTLDLSLEGSAGAIRAALGAAMRAAPSAPAGQEPVL